MVGFAVAKSQGEILEADSHRVFEWSLANDFAFSAGDESEITDTSTKFSTARNCYDLELLVDLGFS